MKMRRNKKLNRKGFTLIELLAVIVILAVIMVIASGSILSSMNESKKKSLLNSAQSAAREFENKYADTVLTGSQKIYGIELSTIMAGTSAAPKSVALNTMEDTDIKALSINKTDYDLEKSILAYDGTKFTVCFTATTKGTFNVTAAYSTTDVVYGTADGFPANTKLAEKTMWACSNGDTSWGRGQTTTNP